MRPIRFCLALLHPKIFLPKFVIFEVSRLEKCFVLCYNELVPYTAVAASFFRFLEIKET